MSNTKSGAAHKRYLVQFRAARPSESTSVVTLARPDSKSPPERSLLEHIKVIAISYATEILDATLIVKTCSAMIIRKQFVLIVSLANINVTTLRLLVHFSAASND